MLTSVVDETDGDDVLELSAALVSDATDDVELGSSTAVVAGCSEVVGGASVVVAGGSAVVAGSAGAVVVAGTSGALELGAGGAVAAIPS